MVTIHCAYTERINPSSSSTTTTTTSSPPPPPRHLSREQIWKALQIKIRHAERFVPIITGCEVVEEKGNEVVRVAHFAEREGFAARSVREVCKSYYPTKVDFWQPDGALITNTISDGPGLDDGELSMTYTFEWRYPEIEEGSEKHREVERRLREGAKAAVVKSLEAMREMADDGELD